MTGDQPVAVDQPDLVDRRHDRDRPMGMFHRDAVAVRIELHQRQRIGRGLRHAAGVKRLPRQVEHRLASADLAGQHAPTDFGPEFHVLQHSNRASLDSGTCESFRQEGLRPLATTTHCRRFDYAARLCAARFRRRRRWPGAALFGHRSQFVAAMEVVLDTYEKP